MDDHATVHSHRIGYHRQPRRHVLQDLQATLASTPGIVRQPIDADVALGQLLGLGCRRPAARHHAQGRKIGRTIADQPQLQPRQPPRRRGQVFARTMQRSERAFLADPDQSGPAMGTMVSGRPVPVGLDARRDHVYPLRLHKRASPPLQIMIARGDRIGREDRGPKPGQPHAAVGALGVVAVALEQGVVDVVDQPSGGASQQYELPQREEFPLQNDGVRPGRTAELTDAARQPLPQRHHLQLESPLGQCPGKGLDAISVADVIGGLDQGQNLHACPP